MPRSLSDLRKVNLRSLIAQWGGPTNLAKKLGHSGPSYLAQLVSENRPITEKTARAIEAKLSMEPGWLDREHDGKARPERAKALPRPLAALRGGFFTPAV